MPFLPSSRYANVEQITIDAGEQGMVKAVKLRRLPSPPAAPYTVLEHDRVDIVTQRLYQDGTQFWHIGDANTDLEPDHLTDVPGRVIQTPNQ
jgi:hypothetical protein